MKKTDELVKEVLESIRQQEKDLPEFIDYLKVTMIGIKLSFRCDHGVAWELVGDLIRTLEKIGSYSKRYDSIIDAVASVEKEECEGKKLEERKAYALALSKQLVARIEKERERRVKKILKEKEKRAKKKK